MKRNKSKRTLTPAQSATLFAAIANLDLSDRDTEAAITIAGKLGIKRLVKAARVAEAERKRTLNAQPVADAATLITEPITLPESYGMTPDRAFDRVIREPKRYARAARYLRSRQYAAQAFGTLPALKLAAQVLAHRSAKWPDGVIELAERIVAVWIWHHTDRGYHSPGMASVNNRRICPKCSQETDRIVLQNAIRCCPDCAVRMIAGPSVGYLTDADAAGNQYVNMRRVKAAQAHKAARAEAWRDVNDRGASDARVPFGGIATYGRGNGRVFTFDRLADAPEAEQIPYAAHIGTRVLCSMIVDPVVAFGGETRTIEVTPIQTFAAPKPKPHNAVTVTRDDGRTYDVIVTLLKSPAFVQVMADKRRKGETLVSRFGNNGTRRIPVQNGASADARTLPDYAPKPTIANPSHQAYTSLGGARVLSAEEAAQYAR